MHRWRWMVWFGLCVSWVFLAGSLPGQSLLDRLKGNDEDDAPIRQQQVQDDSAEAQPADAPDASDADLPPAFPPHDGTHVTVYVVPIEGPIAKPNEYILRRAAREAIRNDVEVLLLELDTPGGRMDVMLDIMDRLAGYKGRTIVYVNDEALSAGAFISFAADEIWYAPGAVIGAAEAITSTGDSIEGGMKRKIESYINAKSRALQADHPHKADVMRAMSDPDFVLERDGETLKGEGELLSLTTKEALKRYGDPPVPLFGAGEASSLEDLLDQRFGAGNWEVQRFEVSAAEHFAKYLDSIAPLLLSLGVLLLFIEFKTPGFGVFGGSGIALIAVFFASQYVAGLAGHEPLVLLVLGVILIFVELFVTPGGFILGLFGAFLVLGSMLWSLANVWPSETSPVGLTVDLDDLMRAAWELIGLLALAVVLLVVFLRYAKHLPFYHDLVLTSPATPEGAAQDVRAVQMGSQRRRPNWPEIGAQGLVTRDLHPLGEVEIDGARHNASVQVGLLKRGERIRVTGYGTFNLIVERDNA